MPSTEDLEKPSALAAQDTMHPSDLPRVGLGPHFEMHPVVFPAAACSVLLMVSVCFVLSEDSLLRFFGDLRDWIGRTFGWLYVATMSGFVVFAVWLATGRYGDIKLGADDEQPEFSRLSWFAMLFSAGMGIGLLFYSVAEPVSHFTVTPPGFADGLDPSRLAMAVTIFHWGLHPWALYAIVGLALAYFGFRLQMPLSFRSLLHPVLGSRVWGLAGDAIDTFAIIATLCGVATSLGIGAQQVNAGLSYLLGIEVSTRVQIGLIVLITSVATISVVKGLDAGIRRLSELNLVLALALMAMVVLGSGVLAFLGATVENIGAYLQLLPFNAFRTGAFNNAGREWLTGWTVFYWAWWISWSPFVGMFIARVSRGRTIREFVVGVLFVPTFVGIAWLTAFGTSTLRQHTHLAEAAGGPAAAGNNLPEYWVGVVGPDGQLETDADGNFVRQRQHLTTVQYLDAPIVSQSGERAIERLPTVLFALIDSLYGSQVLVMLGVGIATLCIVLFFVTSSDSASMVIDIIASGGNPDPPVGTRLFWAITEGLVASALLFAGGLLALQAAAIAAALPLTLILIVACYGLVIALRDEPRCSQARG
ncbi:MAG: BCCT family transporter [Pirellulaceae bacterium]